MTLRRSFNILLATFSIILIILILTQIDQTWDTLSDIQRHQPLFVYLWIVIISLSNYFNLDYLAKQTNVYHRNVRYLIMIASVASILIEFTMASGVFMIVMHWIFAIIFGTISFVLLLYFIYKHRLSHPFLSIVFWLLIVLGVLNLLSIPYFGYMPGYMEAVSIIMCKVAYILMSAIKIEESQLVIDSGPMSVLEEDMS